MEELLTATWLMVTAVSLFLAPSSSAQDTSSVRNTCISCHLEAGDELAVPVNQFKDDVHARRGFSCVSCHGGDPAQDDIDLSMDPRKGFIGKPSVKQVQSFCGKCHSNAETMKRFNPSLRVDQEAEFATSVHGKRIAQGDTKPATCVNCHGSHGIRAVKDPNSPVYATHVAETCGGCHSNSEYMKAYRIPTDQAQKYQTSVHAEALLKKQDLSAPTCNDCHGNHGAAPPGTASVGNVCGTCHARQAELFGKSPHKAAFDTLGLSECVACHSNHDVRHPTDQFIGTNGQAVCIVCHNQGEPGFQAAGAMRQLLSDLDGNIKSAETTLNRAARAGMEVSKAKFELNGARDQLINARVLIHSFSDKGLQTVVGPGLSVAEKARLSGEGALAELLLRRKGLAASLVIITLAALSIYLKLREIEKEKS